VIAAVLQLYTLSSVLTLTCMNDLTGAKVLKGERSRYLYCQCSTFKCSLDNAKRSFHRSLNAVFGKIGRIASEEVTLHLVTSKCLPVLLYDLEACHLTKSDIRSMDFMFSSLGSRLLETRFSKVSARLGLEISKSRLGSARLREASLEISTKNFKLRARVGRRAFQAVCQLLFSNGLNLYPRKKPRRKHHLLDWFTV
jgi:hypothetical protein